MNIRDEDSNRLEVIIRYAHLLEISAIKMKNNSRRDPIGKSNSFIGETELLEEREIRFIENLLLHMRSQLN